MINLQENERVRELIRLAILSIMDPKDREFGGSVLKPSNLIKKAIELEYFNLDLALVLIDKWYKNDMIPHRHLPRKAKNKLDRAKNLITLYDIKPKSTDVSMDGVCGLAYYYVDPMDINSIYVTYATEYDALVPFPSSLAKFLINKRSNN